MTRFLVSLLVIILLGGIGFWFFQRTGRSAPKSATPVVNINGRRLELEVVSTEEDRRRGLSGREQLHNDKGMLFIFDEPAIYPFWMKEMRFALDIIWIRGDRVVEIVQLSAPRDSLENPASYTPKEQADRVLEVPAGMAREYALTPGVVIPGLP